MSANAKALTASRPMTHIGPLRTICIAKLVKIFGSESVLTEEIQAIFSKQIELNKTNRH